MIRRVKMCLKIRAGTNLITGLWYNIKKLLETQDMDILSVLKSLWYVQIGGRKDKYHVVNDTMEKLTVIKFNEMQIPYGNAHGTTEVLMSARFGLLWLFSHTGNLSGAWYLPFYWRDLQFWKDNRKKIQSGKVLLQPSLPFHLVIVNLT